MLAIDDDADVREALSGIFRQWGIAHHMEASAKAALARVDDGNRYDVVLTDQRLADGETGVELIRQIRVRLAGDSPAMAVITGDMDTDLIDTIGREGARLIHKPIQAGQLRALLNHLGRMPRG